MTQRFVFRLFERRCISIGNFSRIIDRYYPVCFSKVSREKLRHNFEREANPIQERILSRHCYQSLIIHARRAV